MLAEKLILALFILPALNLNDRCRPENVGRLLHQVSPEAGVEAHRVDDPRKLLQLAAALLVEFAQAFQVAILRARDVDRSEKEDEILLETEVSEVRAKYRVADFGARQTTWKMY